MGQQRKKKPDAATITLRVGLVVIGVAMIQACNEGTRNYGYDFSAAIGTAFLGLVVIGVAFGIRIWKAMERDDSN